MPTDSGRAATVEFEHVSKVYGPATAPASPGRAPTPGAVNDLSLAIPAGQICVLVGPSGCGKTTSLKMVNRLIEPTSGRILLDGVDAASRDLTDLRRGIGYVIQQTGLFPHQTIVENVGIVPRLLGWPAGPDQGALRRAARPGRARSGEATPSASRASCPAASASGSAWPGPWRRTRRSC